MITLPRAALQTLRLSARRRWHSLQHRERRLLCACAALITSASAFSIGEWLVTEHQQLESRLSELQLRQSKVASMTLEIERLHASRTSMPSPPSVPDRHASIAQAASELGLALAFDVTDEAEIAFTGKGEAGALVSWLGQVQTEHGGRLVGLQVITRAGADEIEGKLRFSSP